MTLKFERSFTQNDDFVVQYKLSFKDSASLENSEYQFRLLSITDNCNSRVIFKAQSEQDEAQPSDQQDEVGKTKFTLVFERIRCL